MISQLLDITIVPVEYQLKIQHAQVEIRQDFQPTPEMKKTDAQVNIQTTQATAQYDSYQARRSLGFANSSDLVAQSVEKGKQSIAETTQDYVDTGKQMSRIDQQVTIPDIMRQKMFAQSDSGTLYTAFLPESGTEITWQPGGVDLEYQPGDLQINWDIQDPEYNYIPGEVHLEILQHARVDIEYLGGPLYFPPSGDPNYKAEQVAV